MEVAEELAFYLESRTPTKKKGPSEEDPFLRRRKYERSTEP